MTTTEQAIPERRFDLKLSTGKVVSWTGRGGEDAARRYADAHASEDVSVVAWREPRYVVAHVHYSQVIG